MLLASLLQGKCRGIVLGRGVRKVVLQKRMFMYINCINVLLLGCVTFCVYFFAFLVSITNTSPLVHNSGCLLLLPTKFWPAVS